VHPPYHFKQESTEMAPKELWKVGLANEWSLAIVHNFQWIGLWGGRDKWTL